MESKKFQIIVLIYINEYSTAARKNKFIFFSILVHLNSIKNTLICIQAREIFEMTQLLTRDTEMWLTIRTKLSRDEARERRDEVEGEIPLSIGTQVPGA